MKTNSLTKILSAAAFVAMLSASSSVFAQVKVGSNPATIGANSNLEVEATNGKKVIVHKDDGTVVIENTPSGAVTDSIMTIDASGNVRRRNLSAVKASSQLTPYLRTTGVQFIYSNNPNAGVFVANQTVLLQNKINYAASTGEMTIAEPGLYYFGITSIENTAPPSSSVNDHCQQIFVNGVSQQSACGRAINSGSSATNTGILSLKAGDKVRVLLSTSSNVNLESDWRFYISLSKLSETTN